MNGEIEKRRRERMPCEYPILCSTLNGKVVHPAVTVDCSEDGIGFVSRVPLREGQTFCFRADPATAGTSGLVHCPSLKGVGLIRIRWCRETSERETLERFRIGARYADLYP